METQAKLRNVRLSPRKARLVVDMVRGKGIQDAMNILQVSPQKTAPILSKLLKSAVANAGLEPEEATIVSARVDKASVLRRFIPRARGRATPRRKPTSHIIIEVAAVNGGEK